MATLNELKEAIIKAHKAGNAEDAKVLAKAITKIQTQSKKPEKLIEKPEKLTEELIVKDPNWIQSSKKLYEWDWKRKNPNQNIPKISNEGYAQFGLDYGSGLAFSDVDLIREGQAIGNATDEQKEAFVNIMNMYDAKSPSLAGAGRAFKNIINPLESPTTYLGFGAGKLASTGVKQIAKNQLKENIIKSLVVSKPGRYALIGSAEGASYGAAYDVARQRAKIRAEGQKDYEAGSIAKSTGIGTVFGGVLGGGVGVISSAITRRKKQKDPEEILSTAEKEEEILKEVVPETQQILSPKPTQINPNSAPALQQKTLEDQAIQSTISKKIEDIVSPMKEDLNISVSEDVGILGKIPYIGNVYKNLANNTLNKIQAKTQRFSTLKDLPQQPQYLGVRGVFAGKAEQADVLARNVFESFNKLTPKQNKPIYEFLTGNKTLDDVPKDLQKEALNLRSGIDTVSEVLERESLISKEVMEENYGTYLPRLFLKYFNKNSGSMGYLKERKNLDAATKDFLGEIEDVGLLGAKAIQDPISDVVKLGFFKEISNNPNWAVQDSLVPFRGKNIGIFHAKSEADRISKEVVEGLRTDPKKAMQTVDDLKKSINTADEKIAKIDKNKFKQISDERKYGELRGMYVRKEIYDDIIDAP